MHNGEITHIVKQTVYQKLDCKDQMVCLCCCHLRETYVQIIFWISFF